MKTPKYLIMDERARQDMDSATVICSAWTLEEAQKDAKEYNGVIVDNSSENITEKDIIE
jgi:hypothetical protein